MTILPFPARVTRYIELLRTGKFTRSQAAAVAAKEREARK